MKTLDPNLEFILDRGIDTRIVMDKLILPPTLYSWDGISPGNLRNMIERVTDQVDIHATSEAGVTAAAADWDSSLAILGAQVTLGLTAARVKYKHTPVKLPLFLNVRSQSTGRDALYREALDFEKAWAKADAAWIFKLGLPLTTFKGARELITVKQADYAEAVKHEQGERAVLHTLAEAVNEVSVDWYQVATAHFAEFTTEGQLIRTIPTTYDPSQPPGKLSFLQLLTPAPNEVHLIWRAPRGQRSYIQAQAPGATDFSTILDGVSQTEWIGMGLAAGLWRFKGKATNQHGEGAESEMVEVLISAAQAA